MVAGPRDIQWILRGVAASAALIAFVLAAYYAGTPEVRVRLDEKPTGFANPITALHLDTTLAASVQSDRSRPVRRTPQSDLVRTRQQL